MALALSPTTHNQMFRKEPNAYLAKPGAIFAGGNFIQPESEDEKVVVDITYDQKNFKEVPSCLRNLLSCYFQGKSLLSYHLYKKRGVAPVQHNSEFHQNMMKVTSLAEENTLYRPYLLTDTRSKQRSLVLTATNSHYITMTFDKEKAIVHLHKEPINDNPYKKMRAVTEGNIKRFKLQNIQGEIKKLLNNLL